MVKGLNERLRDGESVLVAEGYVFEFERRGYLKAGPYVPEIVLDRPDLVKALHEEFVHAGSDVVEAFTYYGHREKLRIVGRESDLENMNRTALRLAKEVADATGTLMAGNICNTTLYDPKDPTSWEPTQAMFKEQIIWAVQEKADFIIAETYSDFGEAKLALETIKEYGKGLPAVITLGQNTSNSTRDGLSYAQACHELEKLGAAVVGLNCSSGPEIMIQLLREVRAVCKGPVAALPVPYRTTQSHPQMQSLVVPETGERAFPLSLDRFCCSVPDIIKFGHECKELGVQYVGLCCGNCSRYFRALAESFDRKPPASKYSPDMSLHYIFGSRGTVKECNTEGLKSLLTAGGMKHRHGSHELSDQNWPSTV